MFKCQNCGNEFSQPKPHRDFIPYGNSSVAGPKWDTCPSCGASQFEEMKICELCGDDYADSVHEDVYPSCINIIAKRFSDILKANFTSFEISILNAAYDGRNLE